MSEFEKLRQQELAKLMATPLSLLSPEAKMKIANHVNSPIRKRRGVPDNFAFALTLAENASMTPIQKLEAYNGALAAHLNKAVADVATTDNVDRDRVVYREHGEKAVALHDSMVMELFYGKVADLASQLSSSPLRSAE